MRTALTVLVVMISAAVAVVLGFVLFGGESGSSKRDDVGVSGLTGRERESAASGNVAGEVAAGGSSASGTHGDADPTLRDTSGLATSDGATGLRTTNGAPVQVPQDGDGALGVDPQIATGDQVSEKEPPTAEEMAALEADRLKAVEVMESVVKSQTTGTPHADIGVGTIQGINARHAPMAIEALTKILPESVEQSPQWEGADPGIIEALTDLAARASDDVLETHVLTPLVGPWKHDVWASNGNRAKFDARIRDAHESVPPCLAMGPRGVSFARVLAKASEYNGTLLPEVRLLIREIADDASIHGAERRAAAEPWVSQLIEWYIVLGEHAPAEHLLWDLDPLDRVGLRIREYGSADGFPDWYDPEEDAELFPTRVENDWKEYLAAKDRPSGVPEPSSTTRVRNWSARLRHHAKILTKVIMHESSGPNSAFGFGGWEAVTSLDPPAELFNNPATIDVDTVGLAEARAKETTWPLAASSAIDNLKRSYGRSAYSLDQLRVASQATLARLLTDKAGSWQAEVRIAILVELYARMRTVTKTHYNSMLLASDGSYGGTIRIQTVSEMQALTERLGHFPQDVGSKADRRGSACQLLAFADAPVDVLLEGCATLLRLLQPNVEVDIKLQAMTGMIHRLGSRFTRTMSERQHPKWGTLALEFSKLMGERARDIERADPENAPWRVSTSQMQFDLTVLFQFLNGAEHEVRRAASPDARATLSLIPRLIVIDKVEVQGRRSLLFEVEFAGLRQRMLFSGWDV